MKSKRIVKSLKIYRRHDIDLLALHQNGVQLGRVAKHCLRALVTNEYYTVEVPKNLQMDGDLPKSVQIKIVLDPGNKTDVKIMDMLSSVPSGLGNSFCKAVIRTYLSNPLAVYGVDVAVTVNHAVPGHSGTGVQDVQEKEPVPDENAVPGDDNISQVLVLDGKENPVNEEKEEPVDYGVPVEYTAEDDYVQEREQNRDLVITDSEVTNCSPAERNAEPARDEINDMMSLFGALAHMK